MSHDWRSVKGQDSRDKFRTPGCLRGLDDRCDDGGDEGRQTNRRLAGRPAITEDDVMRCDAMLRRC